MTEAKGGSSFQARWNPSEGFKQQGRHFLHALPPHCEQEGKAQGSRVRPLRVQGLTVTPMLRPLRPTPSTGVFSRVPTDCQEVIAVRVMFSLFFGLLFVKRSDYAPTFSPWVTDSCVDLQIIRQQFPQLTTRRLGTRGQSK